VQDILVGITRKFSQLKCDRRLYAALSCSVDSGNRIITAPSPVSFPLNPQVSAIEQIESIFGCDKSNARIKF